MTQCHQDGRGNARAPRDVAAHVFSASTTMTGVCLTVIGLLHIQFALRNIDTLADDLLVCNALLYLAVCLMSFLELRGPSHRHSRLGRVVDTCFIAAIVMTTCIGGEIAWALLR